MEVHSLALTLAPTVSLQPRLLCCAQPRLPADHADLRDHRIQRWDHRRVGKQRREGLHVRAED